MHHWGNGCGGGGKTGYKDQSKLRIELKLQFWEEVDVVVVVWELVLPDDQVMHVVYATILWDPGAL